MKENRSAQALGRPLCLPFLHAKMANNVVTPGLSRLAASGFLDPRRVRVTERRDKPANRKSSKAELHRPFPSGTQRVSRARGFSHTLLSSSR